MKGIKYKANQKLKALQMLEETHDIDYVAAKTKCDVCTIYRWKKRYDGTL